MLKETPDSMAETCETSVVRLYPVENNVYKVVNLILVASICLSCPAVSNDHACGYCLVSHELGKSCESGAFHLEVGYSPALIFKALYFLVLAWVSQWYAQFSSLRSKESSAGDGYTSYHVVFGYSIHHFPVGIDDVRVRLALVAYPSEVVYESLFKFKVTNVIASCIEIEQAIEAYGCLRADESAFRSLWLQSSACTNTHYLETSVGVVLRTCVEVDVCERIQFVHHYVNVVTSYTCAQHRDTFLFVCSCYGMELPALDVTFLVCEV